MATCTDCEYCAPTVAYTTLEEMRICLSCLSPWAFWQWDHPSFNPTGEQRCNALVREHGNGRGLLGRADLRDALLRSEQIYQHQLGYPVVPTQIRETIKREPRSLNRYGDLAGYGYGRGNGGGLRTSWSRIIEVGQQVQNLIGTVDRIGNPPSFVLSSLYTPGILDTFTLTLTIPGTITNLTSAQVCVTFAAADRLGDGPTRRWAIDAKATITGTTLTIVGRSWLLARPPLYESNVCFPLPTSAMGDFSLDPTELTNYVTTLEVYQCTVDQCAGSHAIFETDNCGTPICDPNSGIACTDCQDCEFCITNAKQGIVKPVTGYSCTCQVHAGYCVSYIAGDCTRDWCRDVAILALGELNGCICDCDFPCLDKWIASALDVKGGEITYLRQLVNERHLDNPLGTYEAHVHAWNTILRVGDATVQI